MQGATIDGIRHQSDAEYFKTIPGSLLIAVDAPQAIRFERNLHREKEDDITSYDEFVRRDNLENLQIIPNFEFADILIHNGGTIEDLEIQVLNSFIEKTNVF